MVFHAVDPSPSPTAIIEEVADISPGLPGFVVTFFLALAVLVIVYALVRSLRRVTVRAKLDAEAADAADAAAPAAPAPQIINDNEGTV